jgi:hypothetical protein
MKDEELIQLIQILTIQLQIKHFIISLGGFLSVVCVTNIKTSTRLSHI